MFGEYSGLDFADYDKISIAKHISAITMYGINEGYRRNMQSERITLEDADDLLQDDPSAMTLIIERFTEDMQQMEKKMNVKKAVTKNK